MLCLEILLQSTLGRPQQGPPTSYRREPRADPSLKALRKTALGYLDFQFCLPGCETVPAYLRVSVTAAPPPNAVSVCVRESDWGPLKVMCTQTERQPSSQVRRYPQCLSLLFVNNIQPHSHDQAHRESLTPHPHFWRLSQLLSALEAVPAATR